MATVAAGCMTAVVVVAATTREEERRKDEATASPALERQRRRRWRILPARWLSLRAPKVMMDNKRDAKVPSK